MSNKKRITIGLLIVLFIILFSLILNIYLPGNIFKIKADVSSASGYTYADALREVADAYVNKSLAVNKINDGGNGGLIQYDTYLKKFNITPEDAQEDNIQFTVCANAVYQIYKEAFNISLPYSTDELVNYAKNRSYNKSTGKYNDANTNEVKYEQKPYVQSNELKEYISEYTSNEKKLNRAISDNNETKITEYTNERNRIYNNIVSLSGQEGDFIEYRSRLEPLKNNIENINSELKILNSELKNLTDENEIIQKQTEITTKENEKKQIEEGNEYKEIINGLNSTVGISYAKDYMQNWKIDKNGITYIARNAKLYDSNNNEVMGKYENYYQKFVDRYAPVDENGKKELKVGDLIIFKYSKVKSYIKITNGTDEKMVPEVWTDAGHVMMVYSIDEGPLNYSSIKLVEANIDGLNSALGTSDHAKGYSSSNSLDASLNPLEDYIFDISNYVNRANNFFSWQAPEKDKYLTAVSVIRPLLGKEETNISNVLQINTDLLNEVQITNATVDRLNNDQLVMYKTSSAHNGIVMPGEEITYTLTFKNNSNSEYTLPQIIETYSNLVSVNIQSVTDNKTNEVGATRAAVSGGKIYFEGVKVPANDEKVITYKVTVKDKTYAKLNSEIISTGSVGNIKNATTKDIVGYKLSGEVSNKFYEAIYNESKKTTFGLEFVSNVYDNFYNLINETTDIKDVLFDSNSNINLHPYSTNTNYDNILNDDNRLINQSYLKKLGKYSWTKYHNVYKYNHVTLSQIFTDSKLNYTSDDWLNATTIWDNRKVNYPVESNLNDGDIIWVSDRQSNDFVFIYYNHKLYGNYDSNITPEKSPLYKKYNYYIINGGTQFYYSSNKQEYVKSVTRFLGTDKQGIPYNMARFLSNLETFNAYAIFRPLNYYGLETGVLSDGNSYEEGYTTVSNLDVRLSDEEFEYTGSELKPTVSIYDGETLLTLGEDYNLKYLDNTNKEVSPINAGIYKIVITMKGNYVGIITKEFEITRKKIQIPICNSKLYNKATQTLFDAHDENDYYINNELEAKNAGIYSTLLTLNSNYMWDTLEDSTSSKEIQCEITKYDISNEEATDIGDYVYDGNVFLPRPSIIVPIPNVVDNYIITDSEVEYIYSSDNSTNVGNYTVTINAKDDSNYTGSIVKNYNIVKAEGIITIDKISDEVTYSTQDASFNVLTNSASTMDVPFTTSISVKKNDETIENNVYTVIDGNNVTVKNIENLTTDTIVTVIVTSSETQNYTSANTIYTLRIKNAPLQSGNVKITGENVVGNTLNANIIKDTVPPSTYSYQWYRGNTIINGETQSTYTLTNNDMGKVIRVVVTASKENYNDISFEDSTDEDNNRYEITYKLINKPDDSKCISNLIYTSESMILTSSASEGYVFYNNSARDAGKHQVSAKLLSNYVWSDYNNEDFIIECEIAKKNISIKVPDREKVYDGNYIDLNFEPVILSGELIKGHKLGISVGYNNIKDVGTATIEIDNANVMSGMDDVTNNYDITTTNSTLTILKRDITLRPYDFTIQYGDELLSNVNDVELVESSYAEGEALTSIVINANDIDEVVEISNAIIKDELGNDTTNNYNINYDTGELTVNKREIIANIVSCEDKVYDGLIDASCSLELENVVNNENVYAQGNCYFNNSDVVDGNNDVICDSFDLYGTDKDNYEILTTMLTSYAKITPKSVTPIVSVKDKVYDGTNNAVCDVSIVNNESTREITLTSTGLFDNKNVGTSKEVTCSDIAIQGIDRANYTLSQTSITTNANITKKEIEVSWNDDNTFTYNEHSQGPTGNVLTKIENEDMTVESSKEINAGNYTSVLTCLSVTNSDCNNYKLINNTKEYVINKQKIEDLVCEDKTYNSQNQTLLENTKYYSIENDSLIKTNAGKYKVNVTPNSNYMWNDEKVTSKEVTCTILPKELDTSKFSVSNNIKVYNENTDSNINLTVNEESGLIENDDVIVSYEKATYNSADVASATTISVTGMNINNTNYSLKELSQDYQGSITRRVISLPTCTSVTYNKTPQTLFPSHTTGTYTNDVLIGENAGEYKVSLTPTANYMWDDNEITSKDISCIINKYDLSNATVSVIPDHIYDNTPYKPTPSVSVPLPTNVNTYTLTDSEITYTYSSGNPVSAGDYNVTVSAKEDTDEFTNNYTGQADIKSYKILKAQGYVNLSNSGSANLTYGVSSIAFTVLSHHGGSLSAQVTSVKKNETNITNNVTAKVSNNVVAINNLEKLDSGTVVEITVTSDETQNYNTATATYTITITNASITCADALVSGKNVVGDTLTANIICSSPTGVSYAYQWYVNDNNSTTGGIPIQNANSKTYTLTSQEIGNYVYVEITVSKKNYTTITKSAKTRNASNITSIVKTKVEKPKKEIYCKYPEYNGSSQVLTNPSLDGYAFIGNSAVNYSKTGYDVTAKLIGNYIWDDYTTDNEIINCNINKKVLNVTADDISRVYKEENPTLTFTYSENVSSDVPSFEGVLETNANIDSNVGSYDITKGSLKLTDSDNFISSNYVMVFTQGSLTIKRAPVSSIGSCISPTYNGSLLTLATGGDHVTYSNNNQINVKSDGDYIVNVTPESNYAWEDETYSSKILSCNIKPKTLSVTADSISRVYKQENPTFTFTYSGQIDGQTPSFEGELNTSANIDSNVGNYDITKGTLKLKTLDNFISTNYTILYEKGNLEITRKPISLKTCNATYNKEEHTLLSSTIEYNVENSPLKKKNVGEYKVNLTPNSNYMWDDNTTTSKEVTCSILPKELNPSKFSVSNNIKVYNENTDSNISLTANEESGLITGDKVIVSYEGATYNSPDVLSANKIKVQGITIDNNNYTLKKNYQDYIGNITRAHIKVPVCQDKTYNKTLQTLFDSHTSGIYTNNELSGFNTGEYKVDLTPTSNYIWEDNEDTSKEVTCIINPKELDQSKFDVSNNSKVYDENTNSNISLTANEESGLITGDSTLVTYESARYDDKSVSDNKLINVTGISVSNNNYIVKNTTQSYQGKITRIKINTPICDEHIYNGDEQTLMFDTVYYTVQNNIKKDAGTYKIAVTPRENYMWNDEEITSKEVTCSILPKELDTSKFSVSNNIKVYNENTISNINLTANKESGLIGEDKVIVSYEGATYNSPDVLSANEINVQGITVDNNNYILKNTTQSYQGSITKMPISIPICTSVTYNTKQQILFSKNTSGAYINDELKAINVGSYNVKLKLTNNYKWIDNTEEEKNITCIINPYDISNDNSQVVPIPSKTYDGNPYEPIPSILVNIPNTNNITTLTNIDYKLSYENNINAGNGKVKIEGIGNYTGSKEVTFEITKANGYITLDKVSENLEYSSESTQINVLTKTGEITVSSNNEIIEKTILDNKVILSNLNTLSSGTKVIVTITSEATQNYNKASENYTLTITDKPLTGGRVKIIGNNIVGNKLLAKIEQNTTPRAQYTYNWYRDNELIEGATSNEYTLTQLDRAKVIKVVVTASKENYGSKTFQSTTNIGNNITERTKVGIDKPTNEICNTNIYDGTSKILATMDSTYNLRYGLINNNATNAGSYDVIARLNEGYIWSNGDNSDVIITCEILKRNIKVKALDQEKEYDGNIMNANSSCEVISGSLAVGDSLTCSSSGSITDYGSTIKKLESVKIFNGDTDISNNYEVQKEDGTLKINKKNITITAKDQTVQYGINISNTINDVIISSIASSDSLKSISLSQSKIMVSTDGKITPSNAIIQRGDTIVTNNYNISYKQGSLIINKRDLTLSILSCNDKIYDANKNATCLIQANGLSENDIITIEKTCEFKDKNAQFNKEVVCNNISISGENAQSYNINVTSLTSNASIIRKTLDVEWTDLGPFKYDGQNHSPSASVLNDTLNEEIKLKVTSSSEIGTHTSIAMCLSVLNSSCDNYNLTNNIIDYEILKNIDLSSLTIKDDVIILNENTTVQMLFDMINNDDIKVLDSNNNVIDNTDKIKTGYVIKTVDKTYFVSILGDINSDGKVTGTDVAKAYLIYTNKISVTKEIMLAADVNFDGKVTGTDIAKLYNMYKNK